MKLGDNMAAIESCNLWSDICSRKCRPPKIGDIPRHSAVEEELPKSSEESIPVSSTSPVAAVLHFQVESCSGNCLNTKLISSEPSSSFLEEETKETASIDNHIDNWTNSRILNKNTSLSKLNPISGEISIIQSDPTFMTKKDTYHISTFKENANTERTDDLLNKFESHEAQSNPFFSLSILPQSQQLLSPNEENILYLRDTGILPKENVDLIANEEFDDNNVNSTFAYIWKNLHFSRNECECKCKSKTRATCPENYLFNDIMEQTNLLSGKIPTTEMQCMKLFSPDLEMANFESDKDPKDSKEIRQQTGNNVFLQGRAAATVDDSKVLKFSTRRISGTATALNDLDVKLKCVKGTHPHTWTSKMNIRDEKELLNETGCLTTNTETSSVQFLYENKAPTYAQILAGVKASDTLSSRRNSQISPGLISGSTPDRRASFQFSKHQDKKTFPRKQLGKQELLSRSKSVPNLEITDFSDLQLQCLLPITNPDSLTVKKSLPSRDCWSGIKKNHVYSNSISARATYPYFSYSPYGSPQGSPPTRRKPLRERRRISIGNRHGALQLNQYRLLDNIGQGSYGIVKLVLNEEDNTYYAMKILSKKKLMKKAGIFGRMAPNRRGGSLTPLAKVYREVALLKKLNHPNVVKLIEVLDEPEEDNLYLVFELVQKGEVLQVPTDTPIDESTARKYFRDVVLGVEYLHYQKIVHRDIKPSNLLIDGEGRLKIADLGVSAELRTSDELLMGSAGTPAFAAPETTTLGSQYSGTACDIWSLGVTLYTLVTGRVPWDGAGSVVGVQAAIRAEPLQFPEKPVLSAELRELISLMLIKDPAQRITLSQIKEHRWLTNNVTEPLPSEFDNCKLPVTVTDEEVESVVTRVPKLDTLILIKTMLRQHSFQNPFSTRKHSKSIDNYDAAETSDLTYKTNSGFPQAIKLNTKSTNFHESGRSHSAPDSFDWQAIDKQASIESRLSPTKESFIIQEEEVEKRRQQRLDT